MSRNLSLHERFSVSRRNVGFPPIVVAAAILELDTDHGDSIAALAQELERKIDSLLAQYPLLGCKVVDSRTRTPSWAPISPAPTARDILSISHQAHEHDANSQKVDDILSRVLTAELASIRTPSDQQQGPLWRVCLCPLRDTNQCIISLTCDHVINDGRGTLTLFQLLLKRDTPESSHVINMAEKPLPASSTLHIPPPSDKIFDFRPSTSYMLGMIFHELVLPVLPLPGWVKNKLRGPVAWPVTPLQGPATSTATMSPRNILEKSPRECSPVTRVNLFTGVNFITNLKRAAQSHINTGSVSGSNPKAASLHAVIHSLAMTALFAALASEHDADSALEELELCFGSETPVSLRHSPPDAPGCSSMCKQFGALVDPSLPPTTGNFVSCFQYSTQIRGSDCFWTTTNAFARQLASKQGHKAAKHTMGMLAYIPDARIAAPTPSSEDIDEDMVEKQGERQDEAQAEAEAGTTQTALLSYRTGWEKFFGDKARSATPHGSSVEISNLGLIDISSATTRRKVVACTWAQFKAPVSSAFNMDVVGYACPDISTDASNPVQTLSITLGARPAAFADKHVFDRFHSNLVQLVNMFGCTDPVSTSKDSVVAPTSAAEHVSFASLTRELLPH